MRRDLAAHYLAQPGYALARTASLLGWGSAPQLAEASRRWFGLAPAQYRQRRVADHVIT